MKNTRNMRTTEVAHNELDDKLERANKQRAKRNKAPLSKSLAAEIAIKAVHMKTLVEA